MTISTSGNNITLAANGVSYTYNYPYTVDQTSNFVVTLTTSAGVSTVIPSSQYSVSVNPVVTNQLWSVGATFTYPLTGSALAIGNTLSIERILPYTQQVSVQNQGDFAPQVIEEGLDILEMQIQQIATAINSSIQFPSTDPSTLNSILPPAAQRENTYLGFDSAGNVTVSAAFISAANVSPAMVPVVEAATTAIAFSLLGGVAISTAMTPVVQATTTYAAVSLLGLRQNLTASTTYYVNTSTGSNTNAGTSGAPWRTIQYALNTAVGGSILSPGVILTISVTGNSTENLTLPYIVSSQQNNLTGVILEMNGYSIAPTTGDAVTSVGSRGYNIQDATFSPAAGNGVNADNNTNLSLTNPVFNSFANDVVSNYTSVVAIYGTTTIKGTRTTGGSVFLMNYEGMIINESSVLTFTSTPTLNYLAKINTGGRMIFTLSPTGSGSFIGANYIIDADPASQIAGQTSITTGSAQSLSYKIPVLVNYSTTSALTATNWTLVPYDTVVEVGSGGFSTSTHKFTAPAAGVYRVKASAAVNYGGSGTVTLSAIGIFYNQAVTGTAVRQNQDRTSYSVNNSPVSTLEVEGELTMSANDYVVIGVYASNFTPTFATDTSQNFAEFEYISPLLN